MGSAIIILNQERIKHILITSPKKAVNFYLNHVKNITYTVKIIGYTCRFVLLYWIFQDIKTIEKDKGIDIYDSTNKEKTITINALRKHYPLSMLLKLLSKDKYSEIKIKIKAIFHKSYQSYRYRRIKNH